MVQFLIAHYSALEDKEEEGVFYSPRQYAVDRVDGNMHLERGRVTQGIIMGIQNLDGMEWDPFLPER